MRSLILKGVVPALVLAASLALALSPAKSHHPPRIRLALVPLQTAQLGPAGASLALEYGSGQSPDRRVEYDYFGPTFASKPELKRLGRVTGYALEYGDAFTGSAGVTQIRTGVDEYRTAAGAVKGLHFWRDWNSSRTNNLSSPLLAVTNETVEPAPVGSERFGHLIVLAAPKLNPLVRLEEQVTVDRFVLDVVVTAGSVEAAKQVAPHLLSSLDDHLRRMLEGHPTGKPAQLPPPPHAGRAAGGPDLSGMTLQPSDLGESHFVGLHRSYLVNQPALSAFSMHLSSAGPFDRVEQQLGWWKTPTEATYATIYRGAFEFSASDMTLAYTPVDVSAAGARAIAYLIDDTGEFGGAFAYVALADGTAAEYVDGYNAKGLSTAAVKKLALAASKRFDAGLGP